MVISVDVVGKALGSILNKLCLSLDNGHLLALLRDLSEIGRGGGGVETEGGVTTF